MGGGERLVKVFNAGAVRFIKMRRDIPGTKLEINTTLWSGGGKRKKEKRKSVFFSPFRFTLNCHLLLFRAKETHWREGKLQYSIRFSSR